MEGEEMGVTNASAKDVARRPLWLWKKKRTRKNTSCIFLVIICGYFFGPILIKEEG
jgi:hypothetical protein